MKPVFWFSRLETLFYVKLQKDISEVIVAYSKKQTNKKKTVYPVIKN